MNTQPAAGSRALVLAVPAVALVAVLAFMVGRLAPVAVEPGGSPVAGSSASSGPSRSSRPTATILPTRVPTPVAGPCVLPESIPVPAAPIAAPAVEASPLAMTFASHTYRRDAAGLLLPRNDVASDWAMGLWFVAAGAAAPRLLTEAVEGMVLPLAVSSAGDTVAVWWLPERRPERELACVSGIYLVSVADGSSRLLVSGDWSVVADEEDEFTPGGGILWRDPRGPGDPRTYSLPAAAFSANGQFLALVASLSIELYHLQPGGVDPDRLERQHVGECRDWAWSATGASFVAACERTTSAWLAMDLDEGSGPESIAIPYPERVAGSCATRWMGEPSASPRAVGSECHDSTASPPGANPRAARCPRWAGRAPRSSPPRVMPRSGPAKWTSSCRRTTTTRP